MCELKEAGHCDIVAQAVLAAALRELWSVLRSDQRLRDCCPGHGPPSLCAVRKVLSRNAYRLWIAADVQSGSSCSNEKLSLGYRVELWSSPGAAAKYGSTRVLITPLGYTPFCAIHLCRRTKDSCQKPLRMVSQDWVVVVSAGMCLARVRTDETSDESSDAQANILAKWLW